MSWIKILFYNCVVLLALVGMLVLAPPIVVGLNKVFIRNVWSVRGEDLRAQLPIYEGVDWAETYFKEIQSISAKYYDFIVWKSDDYSSETINIVDGLRKTVEPQLLNGEQKEVWFFGGSTMWGVGVNDTNTIPSLFSRDAGVKAKNFGGRGYVSRQSYALLANQYLKSRPIPPLLFRKTVVFYDGANDNTDLLSA